MYNQELSVSRIWLELPILPKLCCFIVFVVSFYTIISAVRIMMRLRSIEKDGLSRSYLFIFATLQAKCTRMHQLIGATFYFFGFVLFVTLPDAPKVNINSNLPASVYVWENFRIYFAFAAATFLVFLALHSAQWFVSSRVNADSLHWQSKDVPIHADPHKRVLP
jgi:hypothetical protein